MPISQGRASRVVDRGDRTILRIGGRPQREAEMMELARAHGVSVPVVYEVLSDGLVLELIEGPLMAHDLARHPWRLRRHLRTVLDLHERLHAIPFDGAKLVHFDLHPENVILSPSGPVLIDWTNAHGGDPDADIALTWLIAETSAGVPGRLAARIFRGLAGGDTISRGLAAASAYRLNDPHVTDAEKARVRRAAP